MTIYLKVSKDDNNITINKVHLDASTIKLEQTYVIDPEKPEVLWNLLYLIAELPIPKIPLPVPQIKEEPIPVSYENLQEEITPVSPETLRKEEIEQSLMPMKAKDIIDLVLKEKGIQITTDTKSKRSIIKQAINLLY